jgi:hypothetical protein
VTDAPAGGHARGYGCIAARALYILRIVSPELQWLRGEACRRVRPCAVVLARVAFTIVHMGVCKRIENSGCSTRLRILRAHATGVSGQGQQSSNAGREILVGGVVEDRM